MNAKKAKEKLYRKQGGHPLFMQKIRFRINLRGSIKAGKSHVDLLRCYGYGNKIFPYLVEKGFTFEEQSYRGGPGWRVRF